ncbi:MAG: hypothetical protein K6B45_10700 [Bacteroidaceae bacterium]|nr:hypothetical protein [Bacteroidaceae bacterium]
MTTLTIRDFRSRMAAIFDKTDAGETVFIRRNNRLYTIVPVEDNDLAVTPELASKIEKARKEYSAGEAMTFNTAAEAQQWMDEL